MLIEKAPAKINLALDVIRKREDNYHDLQMVMTTIDLYDRIHISKLEENKIIIDSNKHFLPNDKRNLVYKAAMIMKEKYNIKTGFKIFIDKNIPIAAGLAGGSSDAAATIRGINKMMKLNLSLTKMISIGIEIGSDVPFCIYNKTALVAGKGDLITPLGKMLKCWVVLVKPLFGVSTQEIFDHIDLATIKHPSVKDVIKSIETKDYRLLCQSLGNSLEDITIQKYPEVDYIKQTLVKLGADGVLMSGSGPTVYGLVLNERKAKKIISSIDNTKYDTYAVRILG